MKKKRMGKKGFMYLLVTSILIVALLAVFMVATSYKYQDQQKLYQIRIRTLNDFVKNFDQDVHRASYIAGFRSLIALEDYINRQGAYLNDTNSSFRETFYYGTINGTGSDIMANSSFSDYLSRVKQIATQVGITLTANVTEIKLDQSDPWSVNVHVIALINISDQKKLAFWNYSHEFVTNVPIYDLRDPLYGINTRNKVPNTIKRLNVSVNGTITLVTPLNDSHNLQEHINNSYYLEAPNKAPSFLDRFEGRNSSSPYGIESVVNIRSLSDQDIPVFEDRIKIDYIYFNNLPGNKVCNVTNIPESSYFVITLDRIGMYNVTNLGYSTTCP